MYARQTIGYTSNTTTALAYWIDTGVLFTSLCRVCSLYLKATLQHSAVAADLSLTDSNIVRLDLKSDWTSAGVVSLQHKHRHSANITCIKSHLFHGVRSNVFSYRWFVCNSSNGLCCACFSGEFVILAFVEHKLIGPTCVLTHLQADC